jgi:hypothetical protein
MTSTMRRWLLLLSTLALAAALGPHAARAAEEPCREWRVDHRELTAEVVRAWLAGAPQPELDAALFELLQREAWLSSCDLPAEASREELVGWRLIGRTPDDYGAAVLESVLERGGFDPELRHIFRRTGGGPRADSR